MKRKRQRLFMRESRFVRTTVLFGLLFSTSSLWTMVSLSRFEQHVRENEQTIRNLSSLLQAQHMGNEMQQFVVDSSHRAAATARVSQRRYLRSEKSKTNNKNKQNNNYQEIRRSNQRKDRPKGQQLHHSLLKTGGLRGILHLNSLPLSHRGGHKSLDFVVAGFPKTGTTTLLYALRRHPEVAMAATEQCAFSKPEMPNQQAKRELGQAVDQLTPQKGIFGQRPKLLQGIKCPVAIKTPIALSRLVDYSSHVKFIVGLRHPVELVESFYNYRITELYDKDMQSNERIPSFQEVMDRKKGWKGVSLDIVKFEEHLQLFLKNAPSSHTRTETRIGQKLFLYTLDQVSDKRRGRQKSFREALRQFLGLSSPIGAISHENLNHFVGAKAHDETINICDSQFKEIRDKLIVQGQRTARWIKTELLRDENDHVVVSNKQQFIKSILAWGRDPCLQEAKLEQS